MTTTNSPQKQFLKDYQSPDFQIQSVFLDFQLHETATQVNSILKIKKTNPVTHQLKLNGENLKLISIHLDQQKLMPEQYQVTSEYLILSQVPNEFTLEIAVEINPSTNKSCEGLYLSSGIFCTQCEAESFRKITYFLDRPDIMTSYTVKITADQKKYPQLLSNGDLIETQVLDNGLHQALWKDPFKKPSYLFALVAGDLGVVSDTFITKTNKPVKLEVYAPHGKQDRCHHALESLKKSMKWDEEKYGLEYDLNQYMIVSIDDFNMGAMENKGLNIFNSSLVLANENSATDLDFDRIESVVAHEYFHNWTGNRVTCRNWFELSLKEGLTVFRDQEFSADMQSRSVQRIKDVDALRLHQFSEDAGPNAHPVRPESCLAVDNFYTSTIYEKGSELIRMIQTMIGEVGFRKGMDLYFKKFDGQAVTIIDFINCMSEANSFDLEQFKLWYSQAGTPTIHVQESYDSENGTYQLKLTQNCELTYLENEKLKTENYEKKPFHIPLKMGLLNSKGEELQQFQQVIHLKQKEQIWNFDKLSERPVLSLNRDFSAPIKLKWNRSFNDSLHLIKYDSDSFNQREALTQLLIDELLKAINQPSLTTTVIDENIYEAFGMIISHHRLDPHFKALLLTIPKEQQLAQELSPVEPQKIAFVLEAFKVSLAEKFETQLHQIYLNSHSINNSGHRALKNKALQLLIKLPKAQYAEMAWTQYTQTKNMTDTLSALVALCETDSQYKQLALKDFHTKWHTDSVVFNKWLQVQAASASATTFENVILATKAKGFDAVNPNNIYSLHGVFGQNYLHFHQIKKTINNQTPYAWMIEEILRIDKINPQVAARMSNLFQLTKKLVPELRTVAQAEIKKALDDQTLSKNAREILQKYSS